MTISAAEYLRRSQSITRITTLRDLANQVIMADEETIKGLKEQEFLEGDIYSDGTLVSYRSKNYELFKAAKNPLAGGAVDLILTGAFVRAMYLLKPDKNIYRFGNRDSKRSVLESKYGKGIFGLDQNVFNKFQAEILLPRYVRLIKETAKIG